MRENVADKRCENGHFIDESWDLCPYCPAESGEQDIPIVRPARSVAPAEPSRPAAPVPAPPRRDVPPAPMQSPPMERTVAVPKLATGPDTATAKRYVVGWLIGLTGSNRGEAFPVRIGRNVLGRDRRSDIVVSDEQASAHHADLVFRPEERRFILMDHNSTNGTYVNEAEIEPRRDLMGKDVVRIGSQKFLFLPLVHDGFYWDDEGALK